MATNIYQHFSIAIWSNYSGRSIPHISISLNIHMYTGRCALFLDPINDEVLILLLRIC